MYTSLPRLSLMPRGPALNLTVCTGPMQRIARYFDGDGQLRGMVTSETDNLDSLQGTKCGSWSFGMVPVDQSAKVTNAFVVTPVGSA